MAKKSDEGEPPRRSFDGARTLWERLQAEDVPRLFLYFIALLLLADFWVVYFERGANPAFEDYGDGFWWALVTVTTVGYGDKFPITGPGRLVATGVILSGIGLVGLFLGKISAILVERRIREGRGLTDAKHLKDHFVILGHKADMSGFVSEILRVNPDLPKERLVVVSQADETVVEELRLAFPGALFLRGDIVDPGAGVSRRHPARPRP